jgi:hypothetical protein
MDIGMDGTTNWLPISEAAPRLGLTVDGLRSRVRRGLITSRKGNDGRLLVAVSMDSAATGHEPVVDTSSPVTDHGELSELRAEVMDLRIALARTEEQLTATKGVATAEIEAMRKQLESGMKAMEAGIAARNAVIEELKAGLDHERARSEGLAHELAEARKGWLERLLEALRRR